MSEVTQAEWLRDFEERAERYFKRFHRMAPGKSAPLEVGDGYHQPVDNDAVWALFCKYESVEFKFAALKERVNEVVDQLTEARGNSRDVWGDELEELISMLGSKYVDR